MFKTILRSLPRSTRAKIKFYRREIPTTMDIPLSIRLKMWKRGFGARKYYYFNMEKYGTEIFLSELFNELSHPKNGNFTYFLDNKLYLPYCLKDFPENTPNLNYLVENGKIRGIGRTRKVVNIDLDNFRNIFNTNKKQIGKIIGGEGGEGVLIFELLSEDSILINNKKFSMEEGLKIFNKPKNLILSDFIDQHEYAKKLNPTTVNTIRLTTAWDVDRNEPYIIYGIQKVGRAHMFGPDNGALGGMMADLDVGSGTVGKIAVREKKSVKFIEDHPDSNLKITGVVVPHFDSVKEKLLEMARHLNFIKYIGWDIVITRDSFKVLEMNSNPDQWASQMYCQFLREERNRKFYSQFVTRKNRKYFMK